MLNCYYFSFSKPHFLQCTSPRCEERNCWLWLKWPLLRTRGELGLLYSDCPAKTLNCFYLWFCPKYSTKGKTGEKENLARNNTPEAILSPPKIPSFTLPTHPNQQKFVNHRLDFLYQLIILFNKLSQISLFGTKSGFYSKTNPQVKNKWFSS